MAGASESAAVVALLVFFEPPAAMAAMEELLLPIVCESSGVCKDESLGVQRWWDAIPRKTSVAAEWGRSFEIFLFILAQ
jgi:hypothetical protein